MRAVISTRTGRQRILSRRVLGELPVRVVIFLRAAGTHAGVRAALSRGGFGLDDDREGWALLHAACGCRGEGDEGLNPDDDLAAKAALCEASAWVTAHVPRLRAAVERLHPGEMGLFEGLGAATPQAAVLGLATLLRRIDDLEGQGRAGVTATLSRRGLTAAERARLRGVVEAAQSAPIPEPDRTLRSRREAELAALHRWYTDWSTTARALIARRDFLIALGVVGRRKLERGGDETADE